MKELLKFMQGGLAGIAFAAYQLVVGGTHPSVGTVAQAIGIALLVRAAGWVVQTFGPQTPAGG